MTSAILLQRADQFAANPSSIARIPHSHGHHQRQPLARHHHHGASPVDHRQSWIKIRRVPSHKRHWRSLTGFLRFGIGSSVSVSAVSRYETCAGSCPVQVLPYLTKDLTCWMQSRYPFARAGTPRLRNPVAASTVLEANETKLGEGRLPGDCGGLGTGKSSPALESSRRYATIRAAFYRLHAPTRLGTSILCCTRLSRTHTD